MEGYMLIKFNFLLKHKKKILIIFTILIICSLIFLISNRKAQTTENIIRQEATVTKGDLSVSITGSGAIASASKKDITSEVAATVTKSNFNVGDKVNKGEILFCLDDSDLLSQIRNQQKNVTNLQKNVDDLTSEISNFSVHSNNSGYVSDLNYSLGDNINKDTVLFKIIDSSKYKISCTFVYNDTIDIAIGDSVTLFLYDTFNYLQGTVTYISGQKSVSSYGGQTQIVEIEVPNPGYSLEGVNAIATIKTATKEIKSSGEAKFVSGDSIPFKSPSSGTITSINIKNGSFINNNDLVMTLENDDLYTELNDSKINLANAKEDLEDIKNDISFYTIASPIDGILTEINVNVGDYVRAETTIAKVVNNKDIEFSIDVDELDISDVKIGQEVNVTVDAIKDTKINPLSGTISEIALEGNTSNDVTTYPVIVSLQGNDSIKIGMNANAEIITQKKDNVLILPVEAITSRKNKNYVAKKDGTSTEVQVGLYNEDNIEIISGLSEGDSVLLPEIKISIPNTKTSVTGMGMPFQGSGQIRTFTTGSGNQYRQGGSK
jgi:HlyD family secretion protein